MVPHQLVQLGCISLLLRLLRRPCRRVARHGDGQLQASGVGGGEDGLKLLCCCLGLGTAPLWCGSAVVRVDVGACMWWTDALVRVWWE
jgi:hypothetical protein